MYLPQTHKYGNGAEFGSKEKIFKMVVPFGIRAVNVGEWPPENLMFKTTLRGNPTAQQLKEVLTALNKCYADIMDAQVIAADVIDDTTNNIIGSAKSYLGQAIDVIWEKFNK